MGLHQTNLLVREHRGAADEHIVEDLAQLRAVDLAEHAEDDLCDADASVALQTVRLGAISRLRFTACDVEGLPVNHQLPRPQVLATATGSRSVARPPSC